VFVPSVSGVLRKKTFSVLDDLKRWPALQINYDQSGRGQTALSISN
jgi:hypothetical protein